MTIPDKKFAYNRSVIVAILAGLAFVSYRGYVDKGYASEAELLLKEVAGASEMYEAMHGGQQTTLDELESKAFIDVSDVLKNNIYEKIRFCNSLCIVKCWTRGIKNFR